MRTSRDPLRDISTSHRTISSNNRHASQHMLYLTPCSPTTLKTLEPRPLDLSPTPSRLQSMRMTRRTQRPVLPDQLQRISASQLASRSSRRRRRSSAKAVVYDTTRLVRPICAGASHAQFFPAGPNIGFLVWSEARCRLPV
jgi:hypothetical protein